MKILKIMSFVLLLGSTPLLASHSMDTIQCSVQGAHSITGDAHEKCFPVNINLSLNLQALRFELPESFEMDHCGWPPSDFQDLGILELNGDEGSGYLLKGSEMTAKLLIADNGETLVFSEGESFALHCE